jgi:hypothetical protein
MMTASLGAAITFIAMAKARLQPAVMATCPAVMGAS